MGKANEEYTPADFAAIRAVLKQIKIRCEQGLRYGPDMPSSAALCLEDVRREDATAARRLALIEVERAKLAKEMKDLRTALAKAKQDAWEAQEAAETARMDLEGGDRARKALRAVLEAGPIPSHPADMTGAQFALVASAWVEAA